MIVKENASSEVLPILAMKRGRKSSAISSDRTTEKIVVWKYYGQKYKGKKTNEAGNL